MKFCVLWVGKTTASYFQEPIDLYVGRIKHYMPIEIVEIPDLRNTKSLDCQQVSEREGALILQQLRNDDYVVLLDDKGKQFSSMEFATWIQQRANSSVKRLVFVIGGAYGFSLDVYRRADSFLSISRMTFSHQIIRPIFLEQLYRAMTIQRGEPYHHEESLWNKK